jgi:hypothetical protein
VRYDKKTQPKKCKNNFFLNKTIYEKELRKITLDDLTRDFSPQVLDSNVGRQCEGFHLHQNNSYSSKLLLD